MFNCTTCRKVYVYQDDLLKHAKNHDTSSISCGICFNIFTHQDDLSRHIQNVHTRSTVIHLAPSASTPDARQQVIQSLAVAQQEHTTTLSRPPAHTAPGTTTPSTATVYGGSPSLMPHGYSKNSVENIKTQKDRIQSVSTPVGFIEIDSSLRRTTVWYFRKNFDNVTSYRAFLQSIESELIEKLRECVRVHPIKYDLKLEAAYVITTEMDKISENPEFSTPARQLFVHSNVTGLVDCDFTILLAKKEHYEVKDGELSLSCIGGLLLGVHQYNPPIDRWSYLPLPKSILYRRAIVNPQNHDQQSFKWAILAKHVSKYRSRVGINYLNEEHRYDFSVLSVPTTVSEIKLFERANLGTSVNVYGVKYNGENKNKKSSTKFMVYPLRVTDEEMPNHFDLLLITDSENKNHYTYISNFSRLVSSQVNNCVCRLIFCKKCFKHFNYRPLKCKSYGEEALEQHRLFDKCVFNPNTALRPLPRRS